MGIVDEVESVADDVLSLARGLLKRSLADDPGRNVVVSGLGAWCATSVLAAGTEAVSLNGFATGGGVADTFERLHEFLGRTGGVTHSTVVSTTAPIYRRFRESLPSVSWKTSLDAEPGGDRPPSPDDPDDLIHITDEVEFAGRWEAPFDTALTQLASFTCRDGKSVMVPTMFREFKPAGTYLGEDACLFRLACQQQSQRGADGEIIADPVFSSPTALFAVAIDGHDPLAALDLVLDHRDARRVGDVSRISLPKFEIDSTVDFLPLLNEVSQGAWLTDEKTLALMSPEPLVVRGATQLAHIDIDETGARGAAVSNIRLSGYGGPPPEPIVVEIAFDKPFAFNFIDSRTRLSLFAGWVADPSSTSTT